jgi:hypothetical protein
MGTAVVIGSEHVGGIGIMISVLEGMNKREAELKIQAGREERDASRERCMSGPFREMR